MEFVLQQYNRLGSTNEKALQLISDGKAVEGMVLWTQEQYRGRGTGENIWESEPGKNLTFSVILSPHFLEPSSQFVLTEMISIALFDVVARRLGTKSLHIKWPNDLYFYEKKLAGVLVQNRISGNRLDFSVLGVGLNVNQQVFVSDAPRPASIIHFSGVEEKLAGMLENILKRIEYYYQKIKLNKYSLKNSYLQKLYRMGEWAQYKDNSGIFTGKITGIDTYGRLLLNDRQGKCRMYNFKEVSFL